MRNQITYSLTDQLPDVDNFVCFNTWQISCKFRQFFREKVCVLRKSLLFEHLRIYFWIPDLKTWFSCLFGSNYLDEAYCVVQLGFFGLSLKLIYLALLQVLVHI